MFNLIKLKNSLNILTYPKGSAEGQHQTCLKQYVYH